MFDKTTNCILLNTLRHKSLTKSKNTVLSFSWKIICRIRITIYKNANSSVKISKAARTCWTKHTEYWQSRVTFTIWKTSVNPLTPVPPVTGRDKSWPYFHFWRHHFWPKLASSILNFCKRKRSFQSSPDQSDGAWDLHKNAPKVEWKTQRKISWHYTWLLHAKNWPSRWRFLRSFLTASRPSRRSITAAKRIEKEKNERRKKKSKHRKASRRRSLSRPKFWFLRKAESQCGKTRC